MKSKLIAVLILLLVTLTGCGSSPAEDSSVPPSSQDQAEQTAQETVDETAKEPDGLSPGMYKVGTDLAAGEYLIIGQGYGQLASDSTGQIESIVTNDNYMYSWYITVKDGEYLSFNGGSCYPIDKAPALNLDGEGMFKVGRDIKAGEYKVTSDSDAYYEVDSASRGDLNDIVSNNNFTGDQYVTVADGQYLKLVNCYIIQ